MIEQNRAVFEYCNIPRWWSAGYTGKGVKIGVIDHEIKKDAWFFDGKVHAVYGYGNTNEATHGMNVADVIHQVAPDADIYSLRYENKWMEFAIANKFQLINMSMAFNKIDEELEKRAIAEGITLVAAAGNEGRQGKENTLTEEAKKELFIAVGACNLVHGKPDKAPYSSFGPEIDVMSFSGIYVHSSKRKDYVFPVSGTSFSSPMVVGMLALWYEWFYETYARYPTQTEAYKFLISNTEDLREKGFDIYTGHGLFILPREVPAKVSFDKEGWTGITKNENGQLFEKRVWKGKEVWVQLK